MMSNSDPANRPADIEKDNQHAPESAQTPATDAAESSTDRKGRKRDKKKKQAQRLINEEEYSQLTEKSKKADEYYAHYVQSRADLDNFRKRTQRDKQDFVKYANERLLSEIIPIMDNFERALTAAEKVEATHNFAVGVEMILKQLRDVLGRYGVEAIDPTGEPFDPTKHEAAESVETTEHPDHTVLDVLQRGYMLNGRVVQPAVVRVAVNPQTAVQEPAPDSTEAASETPQAPAEQDASEDGNQSS